MAGEESTDMNGFDNMKIGKIMAEKKAPRRGAFRISIDMFFIS